MTITLNFIYIDHVFIFFIEIGRTKKSKERDEFTIF